MHLLKTLLERLYGTYALTACALCVLAGTAVVLLTPGMMRRRRVARLALRTTFLLAGMPVHVAGLDNLPARPCMAIANHRSYLDGLVVIAALPARFTPVIKAGVATLPVLGFVLRRVGARFVEREPESHAARDTRHLIEALHTGESLCMFPEGTFSVDGGLLPFRPGAFFLAVDASIPVVPVAIQGTWRVLPPERILPRAAAVQVRVLEPLNVEGAGRVAVRVLRDRSENALWSGLQPAAARPPVPGQVPDYDYYRHLFRGHAMPFAYVDLDLLERNIRAVLTCSRGKRLRVDARVLLCPDIIARVFRSHIRFHGVTCATAGEAIYLATEWGLTDVLIAYPTLQQSAVGRICQAVKDGCEITATADSLAHLKCLAEAAERAAVTLPVCVELDMPPARVIGRTGRRSAVRTNAELLALADAIAEHDNLRFRGVLLYDTQRSDRLDGTLGQRRRADLAGGTGSRAGHVLRRRRGAMVERLRAAGHAPDLVSTGGAATIGLNATDPSITEITIGAMLYGALDPARGNSAGDLPAAGYAAEITRQTASSRYACLGDGYTAATAPDTSALPRPFLPRGAVLATQPGVGEAQFPVTYPGRLRLGDPLFIGHANPAEVCERFSRVLLVQKGAVADSVLTYRGLGARLR